LSDDELNQQFAKQPAWLEAIVQAESGEASTILDFVLKDSRRKPLTLTLVAERLQGAFAAGNTGHIIDSSILSYSVFGFVRKMLSQKDPTLSPAYEACENLSDPVMRQRWCRFQLNRIARRLETDFSFKS
jgi:hypothetical protein